MNTRHQLHAEHYPGQREFVTFASSTVADRVELFDLLQSSLTIALKMLAHVSLAQQKLCNVSFISLQKLFHTIAQANLEYVEFLGQRIRDLGGVSESAALMTALYPVNDSRTPNNFATCIDGIQRATTGLNQLDAQLRLEGCRVIDSQDLASIRLLDSYRRRTRTFTSLIRDNLPQGSSSELAGSQ